MKTIVFTIYLVTGHLRCPLNGNSVFFGDRFEKYVVASSQQYAINIVEKEIKRDEALESDCKYNVEKVEFFGYFKVEDPCANYSGIKK